MAGLGSTTSLVAAAAAVLAVVSAIVAFNGWPGTGANANAPGTVVVSAAEHAPWDQPGAKIVASASAPASASVRSAPSGPVVSLARVNAPLYPIALSSPGGGLAIPPDAGNRDILAPPRSGGTVSVPPEVTTLVQGSAGQAGETIAGQSVTLGNGISDLSGTVGSGLGSVSPELGTFTSDTGAAVGGAAGQLGAGAGGLVGQAGTTLSNILCGGNCTPAG